MEVRNRKGLKRHDSIYVEVTTASSLNPGNRSDMVHVAEVHDSKSRLLGSSGEENWAQHRLPSNGKSERKQSAQLRKKFRQPRKGSETDTLSEVDSGEASGDGGNESSWKALRQDTEDTSDRSSQTLVVPSARRAKKGSLIGINSSSIDTLSTKDSNGYTAVNSRKTRHREPRRGSLTDTLSEATDSEITVARRPVPPPRPSLDTAGDSQELHSQESVDQPQPPVRTKKLKRKKRNGDEDRSSRETDDVSCIGTDSRIDAESYQFTGDDMVVVRVEGCDSLRFLDFCRCPAVRLHVVDPVSGEYKTSASDPDSTIQPLETQPFNMKINRSVRPSWEEDLIIREPSSLIASKQSLLLFELFDYVKRSTVAWAFLKLIASNGASNVGRPLRLQLFKPTKNGRAATPSTPRCYGWWSKGKYCQYKSTLYIAVNCVPSSAVDQLTTSPTGERKQSMQVAASQQDDMPDECEVDGEVMWNRYPGQSCKLPNSLLAEKECDKDGALCMAFSHRGRLLAVPTSSGIQLYAIPICRLFLSLDKQQGLIYDIAWSDDDDYLVSVSCDATACLWHVRIKSTRAVKVFVHPSYVYSCCWIGHDLFATGCSDGVVRVWALDSNGNHKSAMSSRNSGRKESTPPVEFLAKHSTRVNSLVASERSTGTQRSETTDSTDQTGTDYILVSADSSGLIIVWCFDNASRKFDLEKEIKSKEIRGQVINKVIIAGKKGEASRLLVQTKDSLIRLVDLATAATLQVYEGGYISRSKTGNCSLCGCGRRVWAPSEDSSLVAWDYATGERVATYSVARSSPHASLTLALHPLDHIIAYTSHSPSDYPTVKILHFDRDGDGSNVGQVILEKGRRGGGVKWSALETPLYEVPPVRVQPPPYLKRPPSPATPSSRLSPVPTPVPRITRKFSGEGPKLALDSVATVLTNLPSNVAGKKGEEKKAEEEAGSSLSKFRIKSAGRDTVATSKTKSSDQSLLSRDSRLSDIIGKMDLILIQASPKQMTTVK